MAGAAPQTFRGGERPIGRKCKLKGKDPESLLATSDGKIKKRVFSGSESSKMGRGRNADRGAVRQ